MPSPSGPDFARSLTGVRALLLDLDGVLIHKGHLIDGAVEALGQLDAAGIPFLIATNTSLYHRMTLAEELTRAGLPVAPDRIVSAASSAADYCRRRFGQKPLYVMGSPDGLREFRGLELISHEQATRPNMEVAAVVVGDAADDFTPRNLQSAFLLLGRGARFVAMHKSRWWLTPHGPAMDAGGYVVALEFATQRRALLTGKPAPAFFHAGVRQLSEEALAAGQAPLTAAEVAMVGDDLWNDVRGAQKAGLRGIFVRSGKHGDAELKRAAGERPAWVPDAIAPSVLDIVADLTQEAKRA